MTNERLLLSKILIPAAALTARRLRYKPVCDSNSSLAIVRLVTGWNVGAASNMLRDLDCELPVLEAAVIGGRCA